MQNLGVTSDILEDKLLLFSFLQKNQKKITKENQNIYKEIFSEESVFDMLPWEDDRRGSSND